MSGLRKRLYARAASRSDDGLLRGRLRRILSLPRAPSGRRFWGKSMTENGSFSIQCPRPIDDRNGIRLAHGGGGKLTQELIEKIFYPAFANPALAARHDGAVVT